MGKRGRSISLSRDKDHRKALFRNLISALVLQGSIKTTEAKAKAIKGLVDKIVTQAKEGGLRAKDKLANFLTSRAAITKLYDNLVPTFKDRRSGFTRIIEFGRRRGDNAKIVVMEWVGKKVKSEKSPARNASASVAGGKVKSKEKAKKDKESK